MAFALHEIIITKLNSKLTLEIQLKSRFIYSTTTKKYLILI